MASDAPLTIENDVWIEIPNDSFGQEFTAALHKNMADAWTSIEKRFVDDFLKGYAGIKIKTIELFDGIQHPPHRHSSLLRVIIDSWGMKRCGWEWNGKLQDRFTIRPIRWMPASETNDVLEIRSARTDIVGEADILNTHTRRQSFPNRSQWAAGEGEQVAMVLHREYIQNERLKRKPIEISAGGASPNLLLYVHWHACMGELSVTNPSGVPSGLLSIDHASVASHCYVERGDTVLEALDADERELQKYIKRFQGAIRSVRFDTQPAAILNFVRAKPTKSANKMKVSQSVVPKK